MTPAEALLARLAEFLAGPGRTGDPGASAVLDRALAALPSAIRIDLEPRALPVAGLLPEALPACPVPLALAIATAAPAFHWRQNPNYNAGNMGAAFMAGYGYVEFVGPKEALFQATDVRAGLLVLGAGLHYPPHAHPAEEVYHPLTGGGEWRRGDAPWRRVPAGSAIHHPSMIVHETRAGAGTLLALYCWIGDTGTEARLAPA